MTDTAEHGNCRTKVRAESLCSQEATNRNATARCEWPVPMKCATAASWPATALGAAMPQWTVTSGGGSGTTPSCPVSSRRPADC